MHFLQFSFSVLTGVIHCLAIDGKAIFSNNIFFLYIEILTEFEVVGLVVVNITGYFTYTFQEFNYDISLNSILLIEAFSFLC